MYVLFKTVCAYKSQLKVKNRKQKRKVKIMM